MEIGSVVLIILVECWDGYLIFFEVVFLVDRVLWVRDFNMVRVVVELVLSCLFYVYVLNFNEI